MHDEHPDEAMVEATKKEKRDIVDNMNIVDSSI